MRFLFLAVTLSMIAAPVFAEDVTGPKEVGSTTMPPGQYYVTEQISKKSYSLTVTDKGNMILGPAPAGVTVAVTDTNATAAGAAAATTTATPAAAEASGVKGAAASGLGAAASQASQFIPHSKNAMMDGMMRQGIQQGTQEVQKMLSK